jgi:UDP-glucuronate decarboxylase
LNLLTTLQKKIDETLESKNILVTGGSGFLGSWMCDILIKEGSNVTCLDNFSTGLKINISHLNGKDRFHLIEGGIEDLNYSERFEYILHFASRPSPEEYQKNPVETLKVNSLDTIRLLEYAKEHHSVFMFSSSSEVYGDAEIVPTPESSWGRVNPVGVRSSYQESKRFAETACVAYNRFYNVDVRIPRIFNTYGERLRPDGLYGRVLPRFIMQALTDSDITVHGNGGQTRSFCYVTDTCAALIRILKNKDTSGKVINIGNPSELTILEAAKIVLDITGSKSKIVFTKRGENDPERRCPSIELARRMLGWHPNTALIEGIRRTVSWVKYFLDNRDAIVQK